MKWLLLLILASDPNTGHIYHTQYETQKACQIVASNAFVIPEISSNGIKEPFALICVRSDQTEETPDEDNVFLYPNGVKPLRSDAS